MLEGTAVEIESELAIWFENYAEKVLAAFPQFFYRMDAQ